MFTIALAVAFNTGAIATFALLLFMSGTGILLAGVFSTVVEVRMSHRAICYETNRILTLTKVP
jgi:hypothetical protein